MFKKMSLSAKIGTGFGALLIIAIALGTMSVYNMWAVQGSADLLATEYVPEVSVANSVERASLLTMYNMRGYALAEEKDYYDKAQTHLDDVKGSLQKAKDLAASSTSLVKLGEAVGSVETAVTKYDELASKTEQLIGEMNTFRDACGTAAESYMGNCAQYLQAQTNMMKEDLAGVVDVAVVQERLEKITLGNSLIELGNACRIANWRGQAIRKPEVLEEVMPNFEAISGNLTALRALTRQDTDLAALAEVEKAANEYKAGMMGLNSFS